MRSLIITTTAINRPDLHKISFKTYLECLSNIINFKIIWIINIDFISKLGVSQIETQTNLENLFLNYKDIELHFKLSEKPDFFYAVANNFKQAFELSKNEEDIIFLQLEDDWIFNNNFDLNNIINVVTKNCYINLAGGGLSGMQPSLYGYNIFKIICSNLITENKKDPEKITALNFINFIRDKKLKVFFFGLLEKYPKFIDNFKRIYLNGKEMKSMEEIVLENLEHIDKISFDENEFILFVPVPKFIQDIGRDWIKNKNLIKWNKSKGNNDNNFTYD